MAFFFFSIAAYAYEEVSGIVNNYAKVEQVYSKDNSTQDTLRVDSIQYFSAGDLVMILQMKGALIDINNQFITHMNAVGRYEIIEVNEVDPLQRYVVLNAPLFHNYDVNESVQLITIPWHEKVRIVDTVYAKEWDGHTGGIVALIANHKLVFDAPINVSGAGMRGARPDTVVYQGDCFSEGSAYDKLNYTLSAYDTAGLKGEGILSLSFPYLRGKGNAVNGGGGGNGKGAGGYGGGNAGEGGRGGNNSSPCTEVDLNKPIGGKITDGYYANSGEQRNRLFTGGGGGTGTQLELNGSTKGGNASKNI